MAAFVAGLIGSLLALTAEVRAHPMSPAHVRIVFAVDGTASDVTITHARDSVEPQLLPPAGCRVEPLGVAGRDEDRIVTARWYCAPGGELLLVAEPGDPPVIVELAEAGAEGAPGAAVLDHAAPTMVFAPATLSAAVTLAAWVGHGAHHLLIGADHVLLVLGLVLLLGLGRRLVAAITAFTLGHSVSLALGATGVVALPSAVVEAAIAATLVWLALDLVHRAPSNNVQQDGLVARRPWLVGSGIGLVHGLGFAGVLGDLGLPEAHAALALAGFNLGLEVAQLGLVVVFGGILWVGGRVASRWNSKWSGMAVRIVGYPIGIVAAAWFFERAWGG